VVSRINNATQLYTVFDGIVENGVFTEVTSTRFTYSTGWSSYTNQGRSASPARVAGTASQTVTFTTTAVSLIIWTFQNPQGGSMDVYVDNVLKVSYNEFSTVNQFVDLNVPLQ
jgi:hypothetical protein